MPLKKMKPSDKKTWTSALRSGKYKQGMGNLVLNPGSDNPRHCCLGVAQCVLGERQPTAYSNLLRPGRFGLSESVQTALACANDGQIDDEFKKLGVPKPRLNGRGRATFGAIANWVDKYL